MTGLISKTLIVGAFSVFFAGCGGGGGTPEALTEGEDVIAGAENTASEAEAIVDDAVADATGDVTAAADTVAQAIGSAMDSNGEAGWTTLEENWQDSISSVKDRWAELTEADLLPVNGDREQLISLIQDTYGLDREAAENEVDAWASTL